MHKGHKKKKRCCILSDLYLHLIAKIKTLEIFDLMLVLCFCLSMIMSSSYRSNAIAFGYDSCAAFGIFAARLNALPIAGFLYATIKSIPMIVQGKQNFATNTSCKTYIEISIVQLVNLFAF